MLERFRVYDPGQFPVHVIEDVGDGILSEAFKTGIGWPAEMRSEHDIAQLEQRVIRRKRFFDEDVESGAGNDAFT